MILDGKNKVYADIGEDQDVVKMDAQMARQHIFPAIVGMF